MFFMLDEFIVQAIQWHASFVHWRSSVFHSCFCHIG